MHDICCFGFSSSQGLTLCFFAGRRLSQRASCVNAESLVCPYTSDQLQFLAVPAFFFCFVWTVGGGADAASQKIFSRFCEEVFDGHVSLPKGGDAIDFCFSFDLKPPQKLARRRSSSAVDAPEEDATPTNVTQKEKPKQISLTNPETMEKAQRLKAYFTLWEKTIPEFTYDPNLPFHSLIIPTKETVRAITLMYILAKGKVPILLTGTSLSISRNPCCTPAVLALSSSY